jgi:hypothetical protein
MSKKQQKRQIRQAAAMVWLYKIVNHTPQLQPYALWGVLEDYQRGRVVATELKGALENADFSVAPTMRALWMMGYVLLAGDGLRKQEGIDIFVVAVYDYIRYVASSALSTGEAWDDAIAMWKACMRDEREAVCK